MGESLTVTIAAVQEPGPKAMAFWRFIDPGADLGAPLVDSLAELLKKMEQAGKDGSADRGAELIDRTRSEHEAVLAYLRTLGTTENSPVSG